jgi:hypothetical protein
LDESINSAENDAERSAAVRALVTRAVEDWLTTLPFEQKLPPGLTGLLADNLATSLIETGLVRDGRPVAQEHRPERIALPMEPPALWKRDKLRRDTAPEFIKRHYGQYLRADGTGLSRPDIKRLDPQLYTSMTYWLHRNGNKLPDDCPLPTKFEMVTLELSRPGPDPEVAKDWLRRMEAARRRKNTANVGRLG